MAVVKEYKFGGATIRIHDDEYAGVSPEEIERRKKRTREIVGRIQYKAWLREQEEKLAGQTN